MLVFKTFSRKSLLKKKGKSQILDSISQQLNFKKAPDLHSAGESRCGPLLCSSSNKRGKTGVQSTMFTRRPFSSDIMLRVGSSNAGFLQLLDVVCISI